LNLGPRKTIEAQAFKWIAKLAIITFSVSVVSFSAFNNPKEHLIYE
jgi:hypothetical protein